MSELKPCPFCGSEAVLVKAWGGFAPICNGEQGCHMKTIPFPAYITKDRAIAAWNRRDGGRVNCIESEGIEP